ncbi:sterol desaturase family protein [Sphingomonas faeni]|uniref:sterol desaturase family protein n=1 Tax=Sphingomonas TaxID=13687 RepID=UPI003EBCE89A
MWRGAWGGWLITASHHRRHHERHGCNYGLNFRFWDRLCGTDKQRGDLAGAHAKAAVGRGGCNDVGHAVGGGARHAARRPGRQSPLVEGDDPDLPHRGPR